MKCFVCGKEIQGNGVLLSADGDFGCNAECQKQYERNMHEIGEACQTEEGFFAWLGMDQFGNPKG